MAVGAGSLIFYNVTELSSGRAPLLVPYLSEQATTSATAADSVPTIIGTTDVKSGTWSEVSHACLA